MMGERAVLQCLYDMEGEELYSVKWYKAGHEFFRLVTIQVLETRFISSLVDTWKGL
jgi:hypothetical protein